VVQELRGEKIDIVNFEEDPAKFVCNAIAPAEVTRVIIHEKDRSMEIIVPDDQLSLAIGKKGQNVRLAAQLTGWNIDIFSESKIEEIQKKAKKALVDDLGIEDSLASVLYSHAFRSSREIAGSPVEELLELPGINQDLLRGIHAKAVEVASRPPVLKSPEKEPVEIPVETVETKEASPEKPGSEPAPETPSTEGGESQKVAT
jgi:N utilization substance protein A